MSFAPYALLWVILAIAAGVCLLAGRRTTLQLAVSLIATLLATALWLFFRPGPAVQATSLAGRQWAVGAAAWHLTGFVLLLLLAALVYAGLPYRAAGAAGTVPAWLLGLAVAALPVVWAADDRSRVLALALFALAWGGFRVFAGRAGGDRPGDLFWPFAAIFPLWLAAVWPAARSPLLVLSALLLLAALAPVVLAPVVARLAGRPLGSAAGTAARPAMADRLDPIIRPSGELAGRLRQWGRMAAGAGADAMAILEGEFGLLWLLGLLLLLLWVF